MIPFYQPKSILQIGCANGWRLKRFMDKYGAEVCGIDPSKKDTTSTFSVAAREESGQPRKQASEVSRAELDEILRRKSAS